MFVFQFNYLDILVVASTMVLALASTNKSWYSWIKTVLLGSNTKLLVSVVVAIAITLVTNGNWIGGLWLGLIGPVAILETIDPPGSSCQ